MVITDAVTHRHPELARYAKLALSHAIIVGEPIKPSILFQDQDGEIQILLSQGGFPRRFSCWLLRF